MAGDDVEVDNFGVDEEALKNFLGASEFGKQQRTANVQAQFDRSKREQDEEPPAKPADSASSGSDDSDNDDESDEEDEFPVSHEMVIKTHEKAVTTIALDRVGNRVITGSNDCNLKLHDFSSMTPTTIRAFKSVDPTATKQSTNVESHPVHHVEYNPNNASQLLVISATAQPRIFSRDGEVLTEFVKGDMYLRDLNNTKGHISEVTTGAWHPTNPDWCITAGTDSTLRIWDVNNKRSQKEVIVYKSKASGSGGRTRMTAVAWGAGEENNNILVAAALDGSLVMWQGYTPAWRPTAEIKEAHTPGTWTSGIDISRDGRMVVTRGGDDTIKLWDTRKFTKPLITVSHASTSAQYPTSNIKFSPDGMNVITGSDTGHLHILQAATLRPVLVTPVTPGSPVITVQWHERLNQILTGSANAETHVLYNPDKSQQGAVSVMKRAPKRRHIDDDPSITMDLSQGVSADSIVTPGSQSATSFAARHPNVGLTASGRSRDPRRPHIPQATPFSKNQPDEEHIRKNIPLSSMREEDPREALLKYAEKAKEDPVFTAAWKETQPKPIFRELSDDEAEEDEPKAKRVQKEAGKKW